jgi:hypothetical protein
MGLVWLVTIWMSSPSQSTVVAKQTTEAPQAQTQSEPPKETYVYDPPDKDIQYRKDYYEGEITQVEFHGDGPYKEEKLKDKPYPHWVPDWTDVTYLPLGDGAKEVTIQFCGNVLDKFNPHTKIKMMLVATSIGDYNDCYKLDAPLTFGGKPWPPSDAARSSVPGSK